MSEQANQVQDHDLDKTEKVQEKTPQTRIQPTFAAAFNTRTNAIRIHRAACRSWKQAEGNMAYTTWTLEAKTLREAFDEIERTEHATERILPVDACACATLIGRKSR